MFIMLSTLLAFLILLELHVTSAQEIYNSELIPTNATSKIINYDATTSKTFYFTIAIPDLSLPINLVITLTSKIIPNTLHLYHGNQAVKYPNQSTSSYRRDFILQPKNATVLLDLNIYNRETLYFGLKADFSSEITIKAEAEEKLSTPIWETILFVGGGIVSTGVLIWICYKCLNNVSRCFEKVTDCIEETCYNIGNKASRLCQRKVRTNPIPNQETAARVILVASMPDPGVYRFENRTIPQIADYVEKLAASIPNEEDITNVPEDLICSVCLTRRKTLLYEPCKHICCCSVCTREIIIIQNRCPLCRFAIKDIKLAFE